MFQRQLHFPIFQGGIIKGWPFIQFCVEYGKWISQYRHPFNSMTRPYSLVQRPEAMPMMRSFLFPPWGYLGRGRQVGHSPQIRPTFSNSSRYIKRSAIQANPISMVIIWYIPYIWCSYVFYIYAIQTFCTKFILELPFRCILMWSLQN